MRSVYKLEAGRRCSTRQGWERCCPDLPSTIPVPSQYPLPSTCWPGSDAVVWGNSCRYLLIRSFRKRSLLSKAASRSAFGHVMVEVVAGDAGFAPDMTFAVVRPTKFRARESSAVACAWLQRRVAGPPPADRPPFLHRPCKSQVEKVGMCCICPCTWTIVSTLQFPSCRHRCGRSEAAGCVNFLGKNGSRSCMFLLVAFTAMCKFSARHAEAKT